MRNIILRITDLFTTFILIFSFFLFSSCTYSQEDSCSDENLYNEPDSPLRKMPIYHQGGDGFCYAYAATQIIDYFNHNHNPHHENTSAHWLAYAHKDRNYKVMEKFFNRVTTLRRTFGVSFPNRLGYSDISIALQDIADVGTCSQSLVQDNIRKIKNSDLLTDDEFLFLVGLVHKYFHMERKENKKSFLKNLENRKMTFKKIFHLALVEFSQDPAEVEMGQKLLKMEEEQEVKGIIIEEYNNIYQAVVQLIDKRKNKKLLPLFKDMFQGCPTYAGSDKPKIPKFKNRGEFYESNRSIIANINEQLNKKSPAVVGYCGTIFKSENLTPPLDFSPTFFSPFPRVSKLISGENVKICSPHYSLVVGRRKNKNSRSCEFMIRNTYGPGFWNKNKKLQCTCEYENGGPEFDCNVETHGHEKVTVLGCWIPANNLAESSYSVTGF